MGKHLMEFLDNAQQLFLCASCGAHLCSTEAIVSRQFHGRHGRAFLVSSCANSYFAPADQKMLMTGLHVVRDVFCVRCDHILGWTYDHAHDEGERYKVGKYVLEMAMVKDVSQQPLLEMSITLQPEQHRRQD